MKIIKRNGSEMDFDVSKIANAITKASNACESASLTDEQIKDISEYVEYKCTKMNRAVSVEEIQDMVENQIMCTLLSTFTTFCMISAFCCLCNCFISHSRL